MKNLFLVSLFSFTLCLTSQNRQINFEHGDLASVYEKAKKENKLIFIDAYTTWCGPCKQMAKRVFTNDSVADYFNSKFVNYKMDMEKGEGVEFAKKHEVNCYPNLLIIDSQGKLVHRSAGLLEAPVFLEFARTAQTPGKTFPDKKSSILNAGLNETNIREYISLMESACFEPTEEVSKYVASIKETDLIKQGNWELIRDYVNDYNSREIKYLLAHLAEFESKYGKNEVEEKFTSLGDSYFNTFTRAKEADKTAFEKAKQEFKALNWPQTDKIIFNADLKVNSRFNKPAFYALAATDFLKYNSSNAAALNSMAWKFYEEVNDMAQLKAAAEMAKQATNLEPSYAYLDTYAAVLYKAGNYSAAEKMANLSIEKAKKAKLTPDDYKETAELQQKIKAKLSSK